jgi:hypothetical protein
MKTYCSELITADGRRFLLAGYGWSYAGYQDLRVRTFATRADAYRAARKAYKARGDKVRSAPAPEWLASAP